MQNEVLVLKTYISRLAYVQVELLMHEAPRGGSPQAVPMTRGERGVWEAEGPAAWLGRYYTYRVTVYCPWTQQIEVRAAAHCRACCTSLPARRRCGLCLCGLSATLAHVHRLPWSRVLSTQRALLNCDLTPYKQ